jgi:hypothetical protein
MVSAEEYAGQGLMALDHPSAGGSNRAAGVPTRSFQNGKYSMVPVEQLSLFDPATFRKQFEFTTPWYIN